MGLIWVTGCRGLLGQEVVERLQHRGLGFVATGHEVDVTEPSAVDRFGHGQDLSWIVNCAAYTDVDRAQDEPDKCRRLNVSGPEVLGGWARSHGCRVLHLSSDFVFDGTKATPYQETDPVNPLSVYGQTKADGERRLQNLCPDAVVIRTGWLYGAARPGFVDAILAQLKRPSAVSVVGDQWGSPTWARDLAEFLVALLGTDSVPGGTYHVSAEGQASRFEWARLVAGPRAERVRQVSTDPLAKAPRPQYSVLSKEKIRRVFGWTLPPWEASLSKFLRERIPL